MMYFAYDVYDVSVFDGNDRSENTSTKDLRKHLKKGIEETETLKIS